MTTPCSRYCLGPVHAHPQSENLSQDLLMIGQSVTGIPGLLSEVASRQDSEVQPFTERVIDHVYLGFMGILALGSAPLWAASAGVVMAGEKVIEHIDMLHGMATRVQQFGRSLTEQEEIIREFAPLLELSQKVVDLTAKTEQKKDELKKSTRELDELETNYKPHADLLERVGDLITRLHAALTKRISQDHITGLKEMNLTARVTVLKQIEDEERQMKLLSAKLNGLIVRVTEKSEKLQRLEAQATALTLAKGQEIAGLKKDVQSLNTPKELTRSSHGNVVQVFA